MKSFDKNWVVKIFAVILSVLLLSPSAFAGEVGTVTYVKGRVDVLRPGAERAVPIRKDEIISVGDAIRTKSDSKAEIAFKDKSILRLAENTKVGIENYEIDKNNKRKSAAIMLERGKARTIISRMRRRSADFVISTPNAEGTIKGSDVFAFYKAGNSGMLVSEGKLSIINPLHPDEKFIIPPGNSVTVLQGELPKGPRPYLELEKKIHREDTSIPKLAKEILKDTAIRGFVSKVSGDVKITNKGQSTAHPATINETILEGDKIKTGADGMIKIALDNGNSVNLKPNTELIIVKLVVKNLKTGEYENSFDLNMGKVLARIEKLKGGSTFEIRTPTAVCGARGTILLVEIGLSAVRVFLEGGTGSIKDLISGLEKTVEAGYNAYANIKGGVSDPNPTTDQERLDMGEGWEPGSGTEGYSSAEGTVGVYLSESDTGILGIVGRTDAETPYTYIGGIWPYSDVPFEGGSTTDGFGPTVVEEAITSSGFIYNDLDAYGDHEEGAVEGLIALTNSFWGGQSAEFLSAGDFSPNDYSEFTWLGAQSGDNGGYLYSYNPLTDTYTTYDGGAFYGVTGGIGLDTSGVGTNGILDGFAELLYIDPLGNAGTAAGNLAGIYSNEFETYLLGGILYGEQRVEGIGVAPENLYDSIWVTADDGYLYGSFPDEGYIEGYDIFTTMSIINNDTGVAEPWGIYSQQFYEGSFSDPIPDNWTALIGGNDSFGAYYYDDGEEGYFDYDYGYWLANIEDGTWAGNTLSASLQGIFLTYTKMGILAGQILGTYEDGDWQGIGIGEWDGVPLTFTGFWGEDGSLYYNDGGRIEDAGEEWGLIGWNRSPWEGPTGFLAMGEYYDEEDEPYIWNTPIMSYNAPQDNETTIDGGAFYGHTGGSWSAGWMDGRAVMLSIDPLGNLWYITDDLYGAYSPEINMWVAEGFSIPTLMAPADDLGIDPEDFYDYIAEYEMRRVRFEGDFVSEESWGSTYFIADDESESSQPWGIYDLKLGGTFKSKKSTVWRGMIRGRGQFGYYNTRGVMEGDVFGTYDLRKPKKGIGDWIATSVGTWNSYRVNRRRPFEGYGRYVGFMGGVLQDDGTMLGKAIALYTQPRKVPIEEGELSFFGGAGGFIDGEDVEIDDFLDGGDISIDNFEGSTLGFRSRRPRNRPQGIWGAGFNGTYSDPSPLFGLAMLGDSSMGNGDDGYWIGIVAGLNPPDTDLISGMFRGFLVGEGEDVPIGLLSGDVIGNLGGDSTLEAVGLGEWTTMGFTDFEPDGLGDIIDYIDYATLTGFGSGSFEGGSSIETDYLNGIALSPNLEGRNWGIWFSNLGGTYAEPTSPFRLAVGASFDDDSSRCLLGTMFGNKELEMLTGQFKGVWMSPREDDSTKIEAGTITGDMVGYVDVEGVPGTWQALSAGEWVEVSELLDEAALFGADGFNALNDFVSVPITEVHSSILSGTGSFDAGGAIRAAMDLSLYAVSPTALEGIWSALFDGTYTNPTSNSWTVDVASPSGDNATLTGTQWQDNQWLADVSGAVSTGENFTGQAGGTYRAGTFSGVGAGAWDSE